MAKHTVTLTWDASDAQDILGYEVGRYIPGTTDVAMSVTLGADITSYVDDTKELRGITAFYYVQTLLPDVEEGTTVKAHLKVSTY